jgi:alanine dehydrogenase
LNHEYRPKSFSIECDFSRSGRGVDEAVKISFRCQRMLLLSKSNIAGLLSLEDYRRIVEDAFRRHAGGASFEPALAHVDADEGEFHIKAGGLRGATPYFAAKVNGGFFQNRARYGLPNIQGLILLSRADNGTPLAILDSGEITSQRTAAATAVAAKYLARQDSRVCLVCGCGNQGRVQLRALVHVLPFERVFAWSRDKERAAAYSSSMSEELGLPVVPCAEIAGALSQSDILITCTPSRIPFIHRKDVPSGLFIAAVGSDSPAKQELDADLVAASKIVADLKLQAVTVGETHHAVIAGLLNPDQVHAELGDVVAGKRPGRINPSEITIFDSTGTALQDVAAAAAVYEKARELGVGEEWEPS